MKLKTKILSLAVSAVMIAGSVTAMAAPSWKFAGYDLSNGNPYAILEYEVDEKGIPTGNARANGFASSVEWKHSFYEASFPHMGYAQLYLDGKAQDSYAPTTVAASEQDWRPVYWEAKSPYGVYDIMYSKIPGVMDWKVQPNYVKFGNRNADVKKTWEEYGFSAYRTAYGEFVDTYEFLNTAIGADKFDRASLLSDINNSYSYLWSLDYIIQDSGFELGEIIPRVDQEELTGPKYDNGIEVGKTVVRAVDKIMDAPSTASWYNDALLTNDIRNAEVEWVYGGYEKDGLYKMYEVASIDGVLMDGGDCLKLVYDVDVDKWVFAKSRKPYIARYTGGTANPDVQWKAVWPEAAYPFSVYERKIVKDNAGNMVWTNEYRPSGTYAKILPSFTLTSAIPSEADRELKLTFTSELLPDFDIGTLVGTDYEFDGSSVVVFDGHSVPAFQNTVINYNAQF